MLRPTNARNTMTFSSWQLNYYFQPVAIETTGVYGKSTAPVLNCLAKKLVDIAGDPREQQWLRQHLSLAMVRGNTASIGLCGSLVDLTLATLSQCINQCSCPSFASLHFIDIGFRMSVFSVSFIAFSMFFMLSVSVKPLHSIVLLPFSAILTNLILFIFHVPNTTVLLFTVKPFCNLSLPVPLSAQHHLGVLCAWLNTHTMAVLHRGLYNFTALFILEINSSCRKKSLFLPLLF